MPQLEELATLFTDATLDPLIAWAREIGQRVALDYGHSCESQESEDIQSAAVTHLVQLAPKFDPARHPDCDDLPGAFRGFAYRRLRTACVRFADNLRAGGTTKQSVRPSKCPVVGPLSPQYSEMAQPQNGTAHSTDPVSRLRINGTLYALPFERLFRPVTGQELIDLETSFDTHGILEPLATCVLEGIGPAIIDGGHRGMFATRKGLPVAINDFGLITYELAEVQARTLNVHRRHLTADEIKAQKQQQVARIRTMREQGMSLRAIATLEGIRHPTQVNRAAKGVTVVTPVTPYSEAVECCKALDTAFRRLSKLLELDREQVIRLAEECDIPFSNAAVGKECWPILGSLTTLRGMLERVV